MNGIVLFRLELCSMIAKYLWETGSIIIGLMGTLHLRGTFYKNKLHPRNEALIDEMKISPLNLTNKLTLWKSWIGFNATHSSGAIFIGVANFYLACNYFEILQSDRFLPLFTILTIAFYVWVAKKYWFNTVFILLSITLLCFISSYMLIISKI